MSITSHKPKVLLAGHSLHFDAVIPRIGASRTFYGTAVIRQFEMMGVFSANESQAIARSRDKFRALQILAAQGVGLPVTGFARQSKDVEGLIKLVGGAPLIIKLLEGTQGVGVVLAETANAAESVITAFQQLDANILDQEFIKEAGAADIRAFIVNGKAMVDPKRSFVLGEPKRWPARLPKKYHLRRRETLEVAVHRWPMGTFQFTRYFEAEVLRKRPSLEKSWCIQAILAPLQMEVQEDGRVRFWGSIPERPGYYLRVVTLADRRTIHNAFFDRRFHP